MTQGHKPYIIVLGNKTGGTRKSTVAMHIIVKLLRDGHTVASIDADAHQGTLTRYIENRGLRKEKTRENLPLSDHMPIFQSQLESVSAAEAEELVKFQETLSRLNGHDYIVIDTPGSDTYLSRLLHSYADTLITPLNDSFVDLDMLVTLDGDSHEILNLSSYAKMVREQKEQRTLRDNGVINWIVLRNRLSSITSRNKQQMEHVLTALSQYMGFRLIDGFGERVIFRELFLKGLTLLDMKESKMPFTLSHIAAKQELASLCKAIGKAIAHSRSEAKKRYKTIAKNVLHPEIQRMSGTTDLAKKMLTDIDLKEPPPNLWIGENEPPQIVPTYTKSFKNMLKESGHYQIIDDEDESEQSEANIAVSY